MRAFLSCLVLFSFTTGCSGDDDKSSDSDWGDDMSIDVDADADADTDADADADADTDDNADASANTAGVLGSVHGGQGGDSRGNCAELRIHH